MSKHIQVLGILNIIWGSLGLLGATILIAIFGGAMGLIQVAARHDPDAKFAIPIIGLVGCIIVGFLLLTSLPSIIAGIGLLYMAPWSRILSIVVSGLHLFSIPFGTALGIYGLWVLLSEETICCFAGTVSVPAPNPRV